MVASRFLPKLGRVALVLSASNLAATTLAAQDRPSAPTSPSQSVIVGVEAYEPEKLLRFALAHSGATDGAPTADEVARAIEQIYREDGYPLVQVTLAFSEDDSPVFRVDEGRLSSITISGLRPGSEKVVRRYTAKLVAENPVRQADLERALALSSDLSGIAIASEVRPDPSGDGAILAIGGGEGRSSGAAGVEVVPLRPGSAVRGFVVQEFYGVASGGDMVRVLGQATLDRGDDWSASGLAYYRTPIGSDGTYVEAMGGNTVARRDFANITGASVLTGWNAALVVGHPVRRSLKDFTYLLAEYEFVDARSRFLGQTLQSTTHAIRLRALTGADHADHSMYRASISFSGGKRPETPAGRRPDGAETFTHVRAEFGLSLPLDKRQLSILRLEFRGQWAAVHLPEVERIALGHAPFMRGYAPAEVVGDRGFAATAEVMRSIPTRGKLVTEMAPFAFGTVGYTEVLGRRARERGNTSIASVGVGSNFTIKGGLRLSGWTALPLRDGPQSRSGNPAFHASLTVGW